MRLSPFKLALLYSVFFSGAVLANTHGSAGGTVASLSITDNGVGSAVVSFTLQTGSTGACTQFDFVYDDHPDRYSLLLVAYTTGASISLNWVATPLPCSLGFVSLSAN